MADEMVVIESTPETRGCLDDTLLRTSVFTTLSIIDAFLNNFDRFAQGEERGARIVAEQESGPDHQNSSSTMPETRRSTRFPIVDPLPEGIGGNAEHALGGCGAS
jgi:hypothetical protein